MRNLLWRYEHAHNHCRGIEYAAAILAYIVMANAEPDGGYPHRDTMYICICLAVGLVVGCLLLWFHRVGLFVIGALGGFSLALIILSWKSGGVIPSKAGRIVFISVCSVGGGILILFFDKIVCIVSTALVGSFRFVVQFIWITVFTIILASIMELTSF